MHVIHSFNNRRADEHTNRPVAFFLGDKKGDFLSFGENNFTHMQGLFFFDQGGWAPYKTIEDIRLSGEMVSLRNNFYDAARTYKDGAEEHFSLFSNAMLYSLTNYSGEVLLDIDFRHMFDYDDKGRVYSVTQEDGIIIIRYDKFKDHSLSEKERTLFLAIKGAGDYRMIGEWMKKSYPYDASRHSRCEFYIYRALALECPKHSGMDLAFGFSQDKEQAKMRADQVFENRERLVNSMKRYAEYSYKPFIGSDIALSAAMKSMDDLTAAIERPERKAGIFAGFPWFYQFWSRDELISLKALVLSGKYDLVKKIFFSYLAAISDDGLLPNRLPSSQVRSIDSVGWLFMRLNEFIKLLEEKKITSKHMTLSDFVKIKQALEKAITGIAHHHVADDLVRNSEQETWMDTLEAKRGGACIEIQALYLAMLRMHSDLARMMRTKQLFSTVEEDIKSKVRNRFFTQGMLLDCVEGSLPEGTVRPNLFLAYYAYPDLLSKKEWMQAFDSALKKLWMDWGGLTTIGINNPLFQPGYTGEKDLSYHNGDSWFFINNYAAIAMHRLDKEYYSGKINRIFHASREELLFSGFAGCAAELSGAKHLQSRGCLNQAWSNASFIELVNELGI